MYRSNWTFINEVGGAPDKPSIWQLLILSVCYLTECKMVEPSHRPRNPPSGVLDLVQHLAVHGCRPVRCCALPIAAGTLDGDRDN